MVARGRAKEVMVVMLEEWWEPGAMGVENIRIPPSYIVAKDARWPLLGETLHFFAPNTSSDIPPFVKERMPRYGPIFMTSLVGRPVINVGSLHGYMYKYLKNMVLNLFGPESLKKMLPDVEQASNTYLKRWSSQTMAEMKESTSKIIFDLTAEKLISYDAEKSSDKEIFKLSQRDNLLPSRPPWNILPQMFTQLICACTLIREERRHKDAQKHATRKTRKANKRSELISLIMSKKNFNDRIRFLQSIALDLMFVLLFASHETTSLEENEAIIKKRANPDSGLTWNEYKSMKFTFQSINETDRLANIVPGIFRKAPRDIKFKGHTIPASRVVMVCPQLCT
ncbi:Cytochrome [Abeliophyllum distichum]|uniref:Cytochrome n=1 Tax=Abeliophyllum distichum TaxID=126358 RepID=A0ABD1TWC3_9LAMI